MHSRLSTCVPAALGYRRTPCYCLVRSTIYVIPINTIRKLQRKSIKYSQSPINDVQASKTPRNDERGCRIPSTCWFFINKNMKSPSPCLHREDERANTTGTNIKSKANSTVETKTSSSSWCSGTKGLARKRNKEMTTGSPNRFASLDRWQPNLDSIVEEYENS